MQVKKVPGVGKPEDSCTIDGAVCRKNLAHKRMCRHFRDPKILMVAKNLEFNRAQSRLTSLEGMTKQEARLPARQLMSSAATLFSSSWSRYFLDVMCCNACQQIMLLVSHSCSIKNVQECCRNMKMILVRRKADTLCQLHG